MYWIEVVAILVLAAGLFAGLFQYYDNSRRTNATKGTDEIDNFLSDEVVRAVLRTIEYSEIEVMATNSVGKPLAVWMSPALFMSALSHQTAHNGKFDPNEYAVREMFDRFLQKLERIEYLIQGGVIEQRDFENRFSYWLQLMGEKPSGLLSHFEEQRKHQLWIYIRMYRFNAVTRLFERYGRTLPTKH
jgi:hypothetical protein